MAMQNKGGLGGLVEFWLILIIIAFIGIALSHWLEPKQDSPSGVDGSVFESHTNDSFLIFEDKVGSISLVIPNESNSWIEFSAERIIFTDGKLNVTFDEFLFNLTTVDEMRWKIGNDSWTFTKKKEAKP